MVGGVGRRVPIGGVRRCHVVGGVGRRVPRGRWGGEEGAT